MYLVGPEKLVGIDCYTYFGAYSFSKAASWRFQSVAGLVHVNAFAPRAVFVNAFGCFTKDSRFVSSDSVESRAKHGLRAFLEHSGRQSGYQKLEIESLEFARLGLSRNKTIPVTGCPAYETTAAIYTDNLNSLMLIVPHYGSVNLYKTDM